MRGKKMHERVFSTTRSFVLIRSLLLLLEHQTQAIAAVERQRAAIPKCKWNKFEKVAEDRWLWRQTFPPPSFSSHLLENFVLTRLLLDLKDLLFEPFQCQLKIFPQPFGTNILFVFHEIFPENYWWKNSEILRSISQKGESWTFSVFKTWKQKKVQLGYNIWKGAYFEKGHALEQFFLLIQSFDSKIRLALLIHVSIPKGKEV